VIVEAPRAIAPAPPAGYPGWEDDAPSGAAVSGGAVPDLAADGCGSIPARLFSDHVASLHADSDIGFSKEYEEIQRISQKENDFPFEHCKHPENKAKNRYLNIVACELKYLLPIARCCQKQQPYFLIYI
jgi:hypothetical protein